LTAWGTPEEIERRRRIRVAVWAHAYEVLDTSLVSDAVFDAECKLVNPAASTGNAKLDRFFSQHFADYTGQWVHKHPEKAKLDRLTRQCIQRQSEPPTIRKPENLCLDFTSPPPTPPAP